MIRPARDADADAFIALIGACWSEYPPIVVAVEREIPDIRTAATAMAARGGALWAAERDGAVVGMVGAHPAADGWHVSRMYVAAAERGGGLAAALLATAEAHARTAGAERMVLWSDLLFERAHAFYAKHGYLRRGGLRALHDLSNTIEARFDKPARGIVAEPLDVAAAQSAERVLARIASAQVGPGVTRRVGAGGAALFGGWAEGSLCGAAGLALAPAPHRAELEMIAVSEQARRRGVGRALLAAAEAWAERAGRRLLLAYAPVDGAAAALLAACGWEPAGTVPDYVPGGSARLLYRRLNP